MSVFKRADSPYYHWKLQYKKKKYGGSTGTKKKNEALAFFVEQEKIIKNNKIRFIDKTYGELVDYYINTYHPNEQATLRWTLAFWKNIKLCDLDRGKIKRLQEFRAMRPRTKASTVNRMFNTVRSILGRAYRVLGWIDEVPYWQKEKELQPIRRVLTLEEEKRLLKELPPHLKRIVKFALATGLRKSTIVSLTMDMFNPESGILTIPSSLLQKTKQTLVIKLNREARFLILNDERFKRRGLTLGLCREDRPIFAYKGRKIKEPAGAAWRKALKRANVKLAFHELRHTWATRMLEQGMSEAQVAHLGGWTSTRMLKTYAHIHVNNFADLEKFGY